MFCAGSGNSAVVKQTETNAGETSCFYAEIHFISRVGLQAILREDAEPPDGKRETTRFLLYLISTAACTIMFLQEYTEVEEAAIFFFVL